MGESNSKPAVNDEFLKQFKTEFKQVGEHRDHRLGNVKIFEGPNGALVAEKNVLTSSKSDTEKFLSTGMARSLNTKSKYLLKVLGYKVHQEDSMCGSITSLSTYHEYYQNTVQDELIRRNQVNLFYLESELWAILYSVLSASHYLEKTKNLPLSDVRPANIYFTQNGEVKLMPFGIFQDDQTAYTKQYISSEECLLSPEQLAHMRANQAASQAEQLKADVYAIGQTMLMCACLQMSPQCYDYNTNSINQEFLQQLKDFSKSQYSKFFNNILNVMLSENPQDRPTPSMVYSSLNPFEAEILGLKPFSPDYEAVKQALADNGSIPASKQPTSAAKTPAEVTAAPQTKQTIVPTTTITTSVQPQPQPIVRAATVQPQLQPQYQQQQSLQQQLVSAGLSQQGNLIQSQVVQVPYYANEDPSQQQFTRSVTAAKPLQQQQQQQLPVQGAADQFLYQVDPQQLQPQYLHQSTNFAQPLQPQQQLQQPQFVVQPQAGQYVPQSYSNYQSQQPQQIQTNQSQVIASYQNQNNINQQPLGGLTGQSDIFQSPLPQSQQQQPQIIYGTQQQPQLSFGLQQPNNYSSQPAATLQQPQLQQQYQPQLQQLSQPQPAQNYPVYQPPSQYASAQQQQSHYDMNEINQNIKDALQRTQDVINNSNANKQHQY